MFVIPRVGDVIMSGSQPMHMFHLPVLRVGRYMASPEYLFVKRAMDIVISLIALIILSPLLLITAIAVKSDGGPAFYKQVRLTKDGKQFEILKFRSMRVDAEKMVWRVFPPVIKMTASRRWDTSSALAVWMNFLSC